MRTTTKRFHLNTEELRQWLLEFDAYSFKTGAFNECDPVGLEVLKFVQAKIKGEEYKPKARDWDTEWFEEAKKMFP